MLTLTQTLICVALMALEASAWQEHSAQSCKTFFLTPGVTQMARGINVYTYDKYDTTKTEPVIALTCSGSFDEKSDQVHSITELGSHLEAWSSWSSRTGSGNDVQSRIITSLNDIHASQSSDYLFDGIYFPFVGGAGLAFASMWNVVANPFTSIIYSRRVEKARIIQMSNNLALTPAAQDAIARLPTTFDVRNPEPFYSFMRTFGTHYFTRATLGGSVWSRSTAQSFYLGTTSTEDVRLGANLAFAEARGDTHWTGGFGNSESTRSDTILRNFKANVKTDWKYYGGDSFPGTHGTPLTYYNSWKSTVDYEPEILDGELRPIYELILDLTRRTEMKRSMDSLTGATTTAAPTAAPTTAAPTAVPTTAAPTTAAPTTAAPTTIAPTTAAPTTAAPTTAAPTTAAPTTIAPTATAPTTTAPTTEAPIICLNFSPTVCVDNNLGLFIYPDCSDCNAYILCLPTGTSQSGSCGAGQLFNPDTGVCDIPSNVICRFQTEVTIDQSPVRCDRLERYNPASGQCESDYCDVPGLDFTAYFGRFLRLQNDVVLTICNIEDCASNCVGLTGITTRSIDFRAGTCECTCSASAPRFWFNVGTSSSLTLLVRNCGGTAQTTVAPTTPAPTTPAPTTPAPTTPAPTTAAPTTITPTTEVSIDQAPVRCDVLERYNPNSGRCQSLNCANLGLDFTTHDGIRVRSRNDVELTACTLAECAARCVEETSITTRSIDFGASGCDCVCSTLAPTRRLQVISRSGYTVLVRNCET